MPANKLTNLEVIERVGESRDIDDEYRKMMFGITSECYTNIWEAMDDKFKNKTWNQIKEDEELFSKVQIVD